MKTTLTLFILILFGIGTARAEDVALHDGETYIGCRNIGNTNIFLNDPNDYGSIKAGFIYLPNGCASLPQVQSKYLKVISGEVVEMNTVEKAAVDILEGQAEQERQRQAHNAIVDQAKAEVDNPTTVASLLNTCISGITTAEIRAIKGNNPRPSATDEQLKSAVKQCLEGLKK